MRLSIVTFGSEGDTRPLAALCRGLLDRGHDLTLFAEHSTLSLPRSLGIPCEALSGDVRSALPIADPRQDLHLSDVFRSIKAVNAVIAENSASWLRTVAPHARESDAILFSSLGSGVGGALAAQLHKPLIGLFFQPITPTRCFSSPMLPPMNLPGWANRLTFKPAHAQAWKICGRPAQEARREVFGTRDDTRLRFDHPMLFGVSRELVAQPDDWPDDHRICGHWSRTDVTWQAPGDLLEFLAAGEPPIYAGFGSPSAFIRRKALGALIDAVAGRRAVFSPGWSRIDASVLPKNFFIVRDVPHEWLFPRMSMVIHHGGAGTTHTAARAGVPQIVLPIGADHHFWAHRIALRGAAPKYPRNGRFSSKAVAALIDFAQRDETRMCARDLGAAMAREDGVGNAIREIERLVSPQARSHEALRVDSRARVAAKGLWFSIATD
ncbi:UDP:flavonoid glycosyltransferase YjiC (YdhE family) [Povalibacter uvarum]|uniref:UDP:flavonoid glycosyltransferase YjiC (YdhE family) n=1 Tax=Povalibacter uvarum TaxID=732238 RepID=A0A841HVU6_9GAMM|nr:glycosyltransferase [Povalibacter uvarum]MBB6096379.1 UDP:flavonoid glycosyltransferase YjiC (YdhE family) [Povalibacter uvarum]